MSSINIVGNLGASGAYVTEIVPLDRRALGVFNGYDPNQFVWLPSADLSGSFALKELGITLPAAAPTLASQAAGSLTGVFRYRVRWVDSATNTVSLPSAELSVTNAAQKATITRPSSSGVAGRVSHWILERTANLGQVFYPVNTTAAAPYGTLLATTTYQDDQADNDAFTFHATLSDYAGKVRPYPLACMSGGRLFLGGAIAYVTTVTLTNGSANVTSGSGFTTDMAGATVSVVGDTTFRQLTFLTYVSATAFTLGATWPGSTATYTIYVSLAPNRVAWSEAANYEYFGAAVVNGLSNEAYVGYNGEALTAIAGFGNIGGVSHVLYAKRNRLFLHSYTTDPSFVQGGTIHELPVRRGALGSRSLFVHEGVAYGIDDTGIWRYVPNGNIDDISTTLRGDWKSKRWQMFTLPADTNYNNKYWIEWRPEINAIAFWMVEAYQPRLIVDSLEASFCYLWDLERQAWIGSEGPLGNCRRLLCGDVAPDALGQLRSYAYAEVAQSQSAGCFAHEVGKVDGVSTTAETLTATVSSVSAAGQYVEVAGTPWTASAYIGVPATILTASTNAETQYIITANTTSRATLAPWVAPVAGDTLYIGCIRWNLRTVRLDFSVPMRVKEWYSLYLRERSKTGNAGTIRTRVYHVGLATENSPDNDRLALSDETGITQSSAGSVVVAGINSGAGAGFGWTVFHLPLNRANSYDVQFDFSGLDSEIPIELMTGMELVAAADDSKEPVQKTDV